MLTINKVNSRSTKSNQFRLHKYLLVFLFSNICIAEKIDTPIRIDLDQAAKQVIDTDSDLRVLGAETDVIDGKKVHVIKVLTPHSRVQHYVVDADSSEIINYRSNNANSDR